MSQRALEICIGDQGLLVGTLWYEAAGSRQHSSFRYAGSWLESPRAFAIAPGLPLDEERRFFRPAGELGSPLPPALADTTPDAWGRNIIRKERRLAGDRSAGPLNELDFLTAVDDFSRIGALRLREPGAGSGFLATPADGRHPIPPLLHLEQLSGAIASAESDNPDAVALRRLRQIGSSLGGARPKCSVIDHDGRLAIAKFTSKHDTYPVERAEVMTLNLARLCGIDAPSARVEMSAGMPVAIIERFDRVAGGRRPYISAQTMLEAPDATGGTYLELAEAVRAHAADTEASLSELFRRVAFTILVSNVDDHLRNQGFLYAGSGRWRLAPAFDINPAPERFRELKTAIADPREPAASIELLLEHCAFFDLEPDAAAAEARAMADTITESWENLAERAGMTRAEIGIFRPAFEHPDMEIARSYDPTGLDGRAPSSSGPSA